MFKRLKHKRFMYFDDVTGGGGSEQRSFSHGSLSRFPLRPSWLELNHIATPGCRGAGESETLLGAVRTAVTGLSQPGSVPRQGRAAWMRREGGRVQWGWVGSIQRLPPAAGRREGCLCSVGEGGRAWTRAEAAGAGKRPDVKMNADVEWTVRGGSWLSLSL